MSSPFSPERACRSPIRDWAQLPHDVTASILSRLGAVDILETGQMVCKTWHKVCKDPLMWRVVDFRYDDLHKVKNLAKMCRHVVDRSAGKLASINLDFFAYSELLKYITDSSSEIKCLRLVRSNITSEGLSAVSSRLPLLEELELSRCPLSPETLVVIGASCPLLKSLKYNCRWYSFTSQVWNAHALAIAGTMHNLRHLQIFANKLDNDDLQAILDGCPLLLLESLDLLQCYNLNLEEDMQKRLAEQIKILRLPHDSTDDYEYDASIMHLPTNDEVLDYDQLSAMVDEGQFFPWNGGHDHEFDAFLQFMA